jgi:hypothetical protein
VALRKGAASRHRATGERGQKARSKKIVEPSSLDLQPNPEVNGFGVLRSVLERASAKIGSNLTDLTVLSAQVDPYRLDTPSGHRDGQWIAKQLDRAIGKKRRIHWRGLHYALVSTSNLIKPNGERYRNNDENWTWLVNVAGKAARWLGYILFERITDNRNAEPIIHRKARVDPQAFVSVGLHVEIPNADDLEPLPFAQGFEPRQAWRTLSFRSRGRSRPICTCRQARSVTRCSTASPTMATTMVGRWWSSVWPTAIQPVTRCRCRSDESCKLFVICCFRSFDSRSCRSR